MAPLVGMLIQGIGTIGWPILKKVLKIKPDYGDVIDAAIGGLPDAVDSVGKLVGWTNSGYDPTADEIRAELAESKSLHDAIQATGSTET